MADATRDAEKLWVRLKTAIARNGALTYTELNRLEVTEFFIMVNEHETELEKQRQNRTRKS